MTDMKRLLDHGATGFEAMLLGQAAEEQPDNARLVTMLAVMPSASTLVGAHVSHSASTAARPAAGGTTGTSGVSGLTLAGIGLGGGALVLAGLWMTLLDSSEQPERNEQLDRSEQSKASESRAAGTSLILEPTSEPKRINEAVVALELSPNSSSGTATEGAAADSETPKPSKVPVRRTSSATAAPSAPTKAQAPSSLREEISLLERVRAQIAQGDKSAALAGLRRYRSNFPQGILKAEAIVLDARAQKLSPGE